MNYINQLEASFDAHKRNMTDQMKHVHDQIHQLSSRLDDHKGHMVNQIKTLGDDLQNYVDMDVGRMVFRIEGAEAKVKTLEDKQGKTSTPMWLSSWLMSPIMKEKTHRRDQKESFTRALECRRSLWFGPSDCPKERKDKVNKQQTGTPLITIELPDLETKIRVLTSKRRLADPEQWWRSWMRSSKKSHTERLIDLNFQTVLDMIPDGNTMPITGSGRIVITPS